MISSIEEDDLLNLSSLFVYWKILIIDSYTSKKLKPLGFPVPNFADNVLKIHANAT